MNSDNRISATLTNDTVNLIIAKLREARSSLPFLINLSPQERRELPKMGDKSIGFDDKCVAYMASNPELVPGFIDIAEVQKDRELRTQIMRFAAEVETLAQAVDDTLLLVGSEIWMADLAFYQSAREAARRNRPGAQAIFEDLSRRFPGGSRTSAAPAASAKPAG